MLRWFKVRGKFLNREHSEIKNTVMYSNSTVIKPRKKSNLRFTDVRFYKTTCYVTASIVVVL